MDIVYSKMEIISKSDQGLIERLKLALILFCALVLPFFSYWLDLAYPLRLAKGGTVILTMLLGITYLQGVNFTSKSARIASLFFLGVTVLIATSIQASAFGTLVSFRNLNGVLLGLLLISNFERLNRLYNELRNYFPSYLFFLSAFNLVLLYLEYKFPISYQKEAAALFRDVPVPTSASLGLDLLIRPTGLAGNMFPSSCLSLFTGVMALYFTTFTNPIGKLYLIQLGLTLVFSIVSLSLTQLMSASFSMLCMLWIIFIINRDRFGSLRLRAFALLGTVVLSIPFFTQPRIQNFLLDENVVFHLVEYLPENFAHELKDLAEKSRSSVWARNFTGQVDFKYAKMERLRQDWFTWRGIGAGATAPDVSPDYVNFFMPQVGIIPEGTVPRLLGELGVIGVLVVFLFLAGVYMLISSLPRPGWHGLLLFIMFFPSFFLHNAFGKTPWIESVFLTLFLFELIIRNSDSPGTSNV